MVLGLVATAFVGCGDDSTPAPWPAMPQKGTSSRTNLGGAGINVPAVNTVFQSPRDASSGADAGPDAE